jgi:hypothetical protein
MSYWRKSSALESKYYSMHGPKSTISLYPKTMRISYSANFSAQIPESIAGRIGEDFRVAPDSAMLNYILLLGQSLSARAEK